MNRERAKELLPIIQAYADGNEIQWKADGDEWKDYSYVGGTFSFEDKHSEFRIKPEPFECWIVQWSDGEYFLDRFYLTEREAQGEIDTDGSDGRTIHMREVE